MTTAVLLLVLGCLVILLVVAANGYFVAQEFAYMSADRNKLRSLAAAGDKGAVRALEVTERTSFMLSGAQLGITVTGLVVGYVAEPLVGQSLGVILGATGVPHALSISVGTVLTLVLATVVQMIFAELFPKNYAIANPVPLARWLAASTLVYLKVFGWLIHFFDVSANILLKLLRITPVHDVDSSADSKDLEHIVRSSHSSGSLPQHLYLALDRVLDFPDHTIEHAMIPHSRSNTVDPHTTIAELRQLMSQHHTRYPVVSAGDEPLGVVHLIDLIGTEVPEDSPVTSLMREALVIPTAMTLPDALNRLESTGNQLACIIDEYGGFTGLVTIEDLAEEIFGEITDEHDPSPDQLVVNEAPGRWHIEASLPLDEVERAIGCELPAGDYQTLAGLILHRLGRLPGVQESITIELADHGSETHRSQEPMPTITMTVVSLTRRVPKTVLLERVDQAQEETA